jgi:Flp pilus assembly protein TadG
VDTLNLRRVIRRNDAGAELIELAIVMPILVLLLLGIVDFAFLFQRWEVVTNSAREGARLGSMGTADIPGGYVDTDVRARAQSYLTASGLHATANIGVDFDTTDDVNGVIVNTVTVSVSYPSDFIFLPGSINLVSASEMRSENGQ